jgi:type IV fimbrial biogenesis protein FimT
MIAGRAQSSGFTLIELMVGIAIFALLLLIGLPSFTTYLRNSEVRSTTESIANALRSAAAEAANRNETVTFAINGGGGSGWTGWEISYVDDNDAKQIIQTASKKEGGSNTTLTLAPVDKTAVTFTGLGRIANQGTANDHLEQIDVASVVSGARSLRIIVDDVNPPAAGKPRGIRMCDPDPALAALSPPDPRAC